MHCLDVLANPHQPRRLWSWAESYLDVGQRSYQVLDIDTGNPPVCTIEEVPNEKSWWCTALKILSYLTIVLPLFALAVRAYYRSQYSFEVTSLGQSQLPKPEKITARASFMREYKTTCETGTDRATRPWWLRSEPFTDAEESSKKAFEHWNVFLTKSFKIKDSGEFTTVSDPCGFFTLQVRAIEYAKQYQSAQFLETLPQLRSKLEEIHASVDLVFKEKPERIFNWRDACFASEFYSFLVSLEVLEGIVASSDT